MNSIAGHSRVDFAQRTQNDTELFIEICAQPSFKEQNAFRSVHGAPRLGHEMAKSPANRCS